MGLTPNETGAPHFPLLLQELGLGQRALGGLGAVTPPKLLLVGNVPD
jgi:hypothetical protein